MTIANKRNILFCLLDDSPLSKCYVPTFGNTVAPS